MTEAYVVKYIRDRWKGITMFSAGLVSILTAAVLWVQLDLPRFASNEKVLSLEQYAGQVEQFAIGTREIVLSDRLTRLLNELDELEVRRKNDPTNDILRRLINEKRAQVRAVEDQLEDIRTKTNGE